MYSYEFAGGGGDLLKAHFTVMRRNTPIISKSGEKWGFFHIVKMLNPSTPSSCSWKVLRIEDESTAEIISSGSLEMREWNFQLRLAMHLYATNF